MGSARWNPSDWSSHQTQTQHKTQKQIFTQSGIHADLDPRNFAVRESVDSDKNPNSTPIIVAVDETGSMGMLAEAIIKTGLGTIMSEIYDRKPVTDPHLMCAAVGDAFCDSSPIQATQFEASIVLADQVKNFYLEGNGGGNGGESYSLVWYLAAMKTKCDAQTKRGRKGYLFTIGDEPPHRLLTKGQITRFFGDGAEADISAKDLLDTVSQGWEVFHLIVGNRSDALGPWADLLGERAIQVSDHTKLAEVIVSTIQIVEGEDAKTVAASWSGDTSLVVADAVGSLTKRGDANTGVVRF